MTEHFKVQCACIAVTERNLMMLSELKSELILKTDVLLE